MISLVVGAQLTSWSLCRWRQHLDCMSECRPCPLQRRPPAARQLQLHRDEASEDSAPEWDAEEAPPQAAPLHAVRQTCFGAACTDGALFRV